MRRLSLRRFHSVERKKSRWKIWLVAILLFASTASLVYAANIDGYQIKDVVVEGAVLSPKEEIRAIATGAISGKYLYLVPRSFFWAFPKRVIRSEIESLPSVLKAHLDVSREEGILHIKLKEREAKYLWCLPRGDAGAPDKSECFYMDDEGYVFTKAPAIEGSVFLAFSGLLDESPIKKRFLPEALMSELASFLDGLHKLSLSPKEVGADSLSELHIILTSGTDIIISLEKPLEPVLRNLTLLASSADFEEATGGISKLEFIDLRYGTKAFWK